MIGFVTWSQIMMEVANYQPIPIIDHYKFCILTRLLSYIWKVIVLYFNMLSLTKLCNRNICHQGPA